MKAPDPRLVCTGAMRSGTCVLAAGLARRSSFCLTRTERWLPDRNTDSQIPSLVDRIQNDLTGRRP